MASFADQVRKSNLKNKESDILTNSIKSRLEKVKTNKKDLLALKPTESQRTKPLSVNKPVKDNKEVITKLQVPNREDTADLQGNNNQVTNKQLDINRSKQTPEQPSNRTTEQATEQATEQLSGQLLTQPSNRATEQAPGQPNKRTSEQATEQANKRTSEQAPRFFIENKPADLKLNQYQVLHYIYFNRPFKVKGLSGLEGVLKIKYGTVRNCLNSLVKKDYISKPFSINDGVNNGSTCVVNEINCLKLFGPTLTEQPNNQATEQAPEQPNNRTTEQANEQAKPLYIDRKKDLNNLSFYLENSEFWKKDLNLRKCKIWLNEFEDLTPDDLLRELQIGEKHSDINKPNKSKLGLFYIAIKNGGLSRPKGFEFPEEKRLRKRKERLELELKAQKELEEIENQALEIENKKAFEKEIENKETLKKLINELIISESFFKSTRTKKSLVAYKKTGEIDLNLKTLLRKEYLKT